MRHLFQIVPTQACLDDLITVVDTVGVYRDGVLVLLVLIKRGSSNNVTRCEEFGC